MTDRNDPVRRESQPDDDLVVHKSARECPMIEPHPRAICGIVRAREATRNRADEERRRAGEPEGAPGG